MMTFDRHGTRGTGRDICGTCPVAMGGLVAGRDGTHPLRGVPMSRTPMLESWIVDVPQCGALSGYRGVAVSWVLPGQWLLRGAQSPGLSLSGEILELEKPVGKIPLRGIEQ